MSYIWSFVISFVFGIIFIPEIAKYAKKIGFVDKPTKRKTHSKPIPMLSSIIIFVAFYLSFFILTDTITTRNLVVFCTSLVVLGIGLVDDYYKTRSKEFSALPRIIIYTLCAVVVYFAGIRFSGMNVFFADKYYAFPEWAEFIITVLWIVGLTVVLNWIDGLDGLCGGITALAACTFFIVSVLKGETSAALMSMSLVGSMVAYLRYNYPPAKVYMADSGATFVGFMLAVISLDSAFKQVTFLSILVPLLALGVPIFDNIRVVIRRILKGKKIYEADKSQLHHQLVNTGMTSKQVTNFILLISGCLNILSILIFVLTNYNITPK